MNRIDTLMIKDRHTLLNETMKHYPMQRFVSRDVAIERHSGCLTRNVDSSIECLGYRDNQIHCFYMGHRLKKNFVRLSFFLSK